MAVSVLIVSLTLTLGLVVWLHSASPVRVAVATGLIDNSLSDFELGSGCFVGQSVNGLADGVILSPTVGTNFPGDVLPAGWFINTGGAATVIGGLLSVTNGTAYPGPVPLPALLYSPSRTLEFSATFEAGGGSQFAGFGTQTYDTTGPWAIFSSVDEGDLKVRTNNNAGFDQGDSVLAAPGYFGVPHRFRIEWGTSNVVYYIDDAAVFTHDVAFGSEQMRPQFHDNAADGGSLLVDWVRMSDYAPSSCTYTSHVIDSGVDGSAFTGLSMTLVTPVGTAVSFEIITSTNNSVWGDWMPVNTDGTFISSTARYLQYRAALSTTDALFTPDIQSIRVNGFGPPPTAVRVTSFSAAAPDFGAYGVLIGLSVAMLALGARVILWRRKTLG